MEFPRRKGGVPLHQMELMLDFLESHQDLAIGRRRSMACRAVAEKLWHECANILNREGPTRSAKQWSKVWNDFKHRMRSKYAHRNACIRRDGPGSAPILSPIEERVINSYIVKEESTTKDSSASDYGSDNLTFDSSQEMEERSGRKCNTVRQMELMLDFLEPHPEMALGRTTRSKEGRAAADELWIKCAKILNAEGPPRTAKEWAKVWNDYKHRIRVKFAQKNASLQRNGPNHGCILGPLEERVVNTFFLNEVDPLAVTNNGYGSDSMAFECDTGNIIEVEFLPTAVKTESNTVSPAPSESNSASPVPSESNSASPVPSETHAVSSPMPRELNTDFLVPSESNAVASPMPSVPNMSSTPIQIESNAAAFPMPSVLKMSVTPIKSERNVAAFLIKSERNAAASPIPSESNAASFPMPSERNAAAFPIPSERNAAAFPMPSERNAAAFLVPSERNAAAFLVPSDPNAAASLVPSVSGQVPSPSSETYSVMRVRKRRRADFERLKYLKSIATSLERLTETYCKRHKI